MPARRPWEMLRETRYIMFGPGVSTIPNATSATPAAAPIVIMMSTLPVRGLRVEGQSEVRGS
ncbi:hypothetical protein GCM10010532_066210 [Dactylosporangium siamense]|uniref:Uncharacterized protein n=1 Tax=Dactylosporangium siamense TaxID=685454 RepID=A0A919UCE7_9ACTN|nr:hypothetical protein Dsi01nite_047470 [Dactylosporangium siamense]